MNNIDSLIGKSKSIEDGIENIFREKGIVGVNSDHSEIPPQFRSFRQSVATVIVPENWRDFLSKMEEMPVGMGVQSQRQVLEFIGGGLSSEQEKSVEVDHARGNDVDPRLLVKGKLPQYLYFLMQGAHLLDHGELFQPTFNTRLGMKALLLRELRREIREETGKNAEKTITLGDVFPLEPKVTQLTTAGFGNMNDEIQKKLADQGIRFTEDKKKLMGFLLEIKELGMLGVADLERLIQYAEETEEVRAMTSITIGKLLAKGEEAMANGVEGWNGWDTESQGNKPRNPSVFYLLQGVLKFMKAHSE